MLSCRDISCRPYTGNRPTRTSDFGIDARYTLETLNGEGGKGVSTEGSERAQPLKSIVTRMYIRKHLITLTQEAYFVPVLR